jgi:hypothetical protein
VDFQQRANNTRGSLTTHRCRVLLDACFTYIVFVGGWRVTEDLRNVWGLTVSVIDTNAVAGVL